MDEKMVTIYVDGYPRVCPESEVAAVLENIERLKEHYREKGVPEETLEKLYSVRIVGDEKKLTPGQGEERVSMTVEDAMKLAARLSKELDEKGYEPDGSVSPSLRIAQHIGMRPGRMRRNSEQS